MTEQRNRRSVRRHLAVSIVLAWLAAFVAVVWIGGASWQRAMFAAAFTGPCWATVGAAYSDFEHRRRTKA